MPVVSMVVPKVRACRAATRSPNLARCCSTRYSTTSARWRTCPRWPSTRRTIVSRPSAGTSRRPGRATRRPPRGWRR